MFMQKNHKKQRKILLVSCILLLFLSLGTSNSYSVSVFWKTGKSAKAATAITVTSHKKFIKAIYKMALKREISGTFYYEGDSNDIFDGDIDQLLQEVCAIDKKTSSDADYLANSISTINVRTSYQYIGDTIIDSTLTVQIRYLETMAQLEAVNAGVEQVLAELGVEGKSDYKKVKLIHDYIVNNTRYQFGSNCYTAYGALLEGRAVCQGYAQLTYKMLREAGLSCYVITGQANNGSRTEDHAWNIVKVGKKWYYLDTTWDDPAGGEDVLRYDYFLVGSDKMDQDHAAFLGQEEKIVNVSRTNHKKWESLQEQEDDLYLYGFGL